MDTLGEWTRQREKVWKKRRRGKCDSQVCHLYGGGRWLSTEQFDGSHTIINGIFPLISGFWLLVLLELLPFLVRITNHTQTCLYLWNSPFVFSGISLFCQAPPNRLSLVTNMIPSPPPPQHTPALPKNPRSKESLETGLPTYSVIQNKAFHLSASEYMLFPSATPDIHTPTLHTQTGRAPLSGQSASTCYQLSLHLALQSWGEVIARLCWKNLEIESLGIVNLGWIIAAGGTERFRVRKDLLN